MYTLKKFIENVQHSSTNEFSKNKIANNVTSDIIQAIINKLNVSSNSVQIAQLKEIKRLLFK